MPLLLAIEPDKRHASFIEEQARDRLGAELIVTESMDAALQSIRKQVPDLILTSLLLSPKDESRLQEQLRQLDALGIHVQTLVIPVMAEPAVEPAKSGGVLSRLRKKRAPSEEGCDPAVFGAQIAEYLQGATKKNSKAHHRRPADKPDPSPVETPVVETPAAPADDRVEVASLSGAPPSPLADAEPLPPFATVDAIVIDDLPTAESIAQLLEELKPVANEPSLVQAEAPLVKVEAPLAEPPAGAIDEPTIQSVDEAHLLDVFGDADRSWRPRQLLVIEENEYDAASLLSFFKEASDVVPDRASWLLTASPSAATGVDMGGAETMAALRQELERQRPVAPQA